MDSQLSDYERNPLPMRMAASQAMQKWRTPPAPIRINRKGRRVLAKEEVKDGYEAAFSAMDKIVKEEVVDPSYEHGSNISSQQDRRFPRREDYQQALLDVWNRSLPKCSEYYLDPSDFAILNSRASARKIGNSDLDINEGVMGSGKENNGATMFATVKEEPLDYNDVNPATQLKVEPIVIDSETRKDIERWIYLKKQVAKTKENIKCVEEFFEWDKQCLKLLDDVSVLLPSCSTEANETGVAGGQSLTGDATTTV